MAETKGAVRGQLGLLLGAKAVSDIGYALDFVCLSIFVWESTRSTLATGLVSVALYAGQILGGRLGHAYGARWDRRSVMVVADLVRMAALLTLAVLPGQPQLYVAVFLVGIGRSVFEGTLSAATPVLAGERAQFVNSVLAGIKGIGFMAGMSLSAVAVPVIGFQGVFALDAASYALSALVLLAIRIPFRDSEPATPADSKKLLWPLVVAAGLVPLFVVRCLDAFGSSSQHVGIPVLGSELSPDTPTEAAGVIWGVWAAGLLAAGFVFRPLATKVIARAPGVVFCLATVLMSLGFIGIFWFDEWPLRLAGAALAGIGDAFSEVAFKQAVQRLPDQQRGQAFGLSQIVVNSGFMAGLVATSFLLTPDFVPEWVLILHGVPMLVAVAAIARVRAR
ncbi:MFS transporter [Actinokineospora diospyrosa]|uniref:Arabinose efflux permease, MFS family n=1 Tax=Actinokineospora diospyrosa TaxID=103728 RepID=A0ABT1IBS4_9PSEU|nr:MFS transporter [Actinokineospora diospyrosa]MCP2270088.1 putative arabinose efflux permease, MFS family [Actinokineospora diospyrosa]